MNTKIFYVLTVLLILLSACEEGAQPDVSYVPIDQIDVEPGPDDVLEEE